MRPFGGPNKRPKAASRNHLKTRTLRAEPLERRELLSVSVVGDELRILGTADDDYASVARRTHEEWSEDGRRLEVLGIREYLEVTLNGEVLQLHFHDRLPGPQEPSKIVFRGYGGDDRFFNHTGKPSTAYGGTGRDTLYGGSGGDLLIGGVVSRALVGVRPSEMVEVMLTAEQVSALCEREKILVEMVPSNE